MLCFVSYSSSKIWALLGLGDVLKRGLGVELVSCSLIC